jgi:hypothetical protein
MTNDWTIQSRSIHCAATGAEFTEGEYFYTLLFDEKAGFRREDLCEEAFKSRPETPAPFSFWRSKFEPPQAAPPEAVSRQTAEDLLRSYMMESGVEHANARYILALMLERKRILREVEVKRSEDGSLTRIYERAKTGEVFIIPDPELRLDQVEQVQMQVAGLLGGAPIASPAPEAQADSAPAEPEPDVPSPS